MQADVQLVQADVQRVQADVLLCLHHNALVRAVHNRSILLQNPEYFITERNERGREEKEGREEGTFK